MLRTSMILAAIAAVGAMAAEIPAGTPVSVRVGQTISSKNAKSGDPWVGTLAADLAIDGNVIAKRGAPIRGIDSSNASSNAMLYAELFAVEWRAKKCTVDGQKNRMLNWPPHQPIITIK